MWKKSLTVCGVLGLGATLWAAMPAQGSIASFSDDFTGTAGSAPDSSLWTNAVAPTNGTVKLTQDGNSNLVGDVSAQAGNSNHAVIRSVRSDFDFFQQPLTVQWKLTSLTGTTTATGDLNNSNRAYLMIVGNDNGTQTTTNAIPGGAIPSFGLVVDRLTDTTTSAVSYVFRLEQTVTQGGGNNVIFLTSKTLSGSTLPSLITIQFDHVPNASNPDKGELTVDLTGGTFTDTTNTLTAVSRELNSTYNPGILTEAAYNGTFYLAAGGINNGASNTNAGTIAKFDSINVVVPEPASLGLLGLGSLLMLWPRRPVMAD